MARCRLKIDRAFGKAYYAADERIVERKKMVPRFL